jgi:glycosyltransferase involved in cell wall biosynthesis
MVQLPWLSVVIPVYDGRRYLAAALESVLQQAGPDVEILVTDDGSTDGSRAIIDTYAEQGRIVALDGPRTGNWVANTNAAVRHSRGEYVTFLHQDDLWLPGRLASVRSQIDLQPSHLLRVAPTQFIDSAGRRVGTWRLPFPARMKSVEPTTFLEHLLVQNFIGMPTPVFPRAAFDRVGGMDEDLWFTADWDLWIKLGVQATVGVCSQATTAFRIHRASQTMAGAAAHASMRAQMEVVRARHLPAITDAATRDCVDRAGRFSCELNSGLASAVAGDRVQWRRLLDAFRALGIDGSRRFLRDARFGERSMARLRTSLTSGKA